MKKYLLILAAISFSAISLSAQNDAAGDWAQFGRYAAANSEVDEKPYAVLMGDSITDAWDGKDPEFLEENNILCRGISGQNSSQMLVRFRQDVIDLDPKYVVILAGTNDIACNGGYISVNLPGHTRSGLFSVPSRHRSSSGGGKALPAFPTRYSG